MEEAVVNRLFAGLMGPLFFFVPLPAYCQHVDSRAVPPELTPAYIQINPKTILATVSFLASDEMAGRDTPSRELAIASAYVASRFRGAGLSGGGEGNGYYQTAEVATLQLPETGIQLLQNGQPVQHFGLLSGDSQAFSFSGKMTSVSMKDNIRALRFRGPVYFDAGDLSGRRAIANLTRQLASLRRNGATAILIPVVLGHPLIALAQKKREPVLVQPRGGFSGPILLVSERDSMEGMEIGIPQHAGGKASVHNVIGILRGSDPELAKEAIVFTAHLDHIGSKFGRGDTVFNGADDDASGVTAVLTLADAFAALPSPPKRTVIFMTYWGEEKGLLGSRYYAKNPVWPLEKTVANINIEMIGRPEPGANEKIWATGWHQSDLGPLMNRGASGVGVLIFEHPAFSSMLYRASDNYSLVEKGVIAHSFSAGSMHGDYHQVGDEWEKLELRHMARVIEGLFAGSFPIANGEVTPKKR